MAVEDELSIKLTIAGRVYPLKIERVQEEVMRKAAKMINERVKAYEELYSVRDNQDLLAMAALEYANQVISGQPGKIMEDDGELVDKMKNIDQLVSGYLASK